MLITSQGTRYFMGYQNMTKKETKETKTKIKKSPHHALWFK